VPVKYWEIIADNLSKPDGVGAAFRPLIVRGGQSGLLTRIAMMESVTSYAQIKNSLRFWNWKGRFVSAY
jgi:hypothetical protein